MAADWPNMGQSQIFFDHFEMKDNFVEQKFEHTTEISQSLFALLTQLKQPVGVSRDDLRFITTLCTQPNHSNFKCVLHNNFM